MSVEEPKELTAVIGENARRLRVESGATMETVVKFAKHAGLKWTTARVVELERGKFTPSLPTLLVLAHALTLATREEVTLAALVRHDGAVRVNERTILLGAALERYVSGEGVKFRLLEQPGTLDRITSGLEQAAAELPANLTLEDDPETFLSSYTLGDERAARTLGLTKQKMMERALGLWGHNLSTERDRRAGADASAQKRGQVTRQLLGEARKASRGDS